MSGAPRDFARELYPFLYAPAATDGDSLPALLDAVRRSTADKHWVGSAAKARWLSVSISPHATRLRNMTAIFPIIATDCQNRLPPRKR